MLSRTANGLFWMSRYIERMENVARLLDAGRRIDALPGTGPSKASEWASIVIASGCQDTYPGALEHADQASVCMHLIFDEKNPSSIKASMQTARDNARAMRAAITTEVWDALNQSWTEMKRLQPNAVLGRGLPEFLDWVKARGALARGALDATLLRDEGYGFIQLGKRIERADATARLLDVKYHVLLPQSAEIGGGLDYLQWMQVLRAANAAGAYRHVYGRSVDAAGVVDLLVCNTMSPRSLASSVSRIAYELEIIGVHTEAQAAVLAEARALGAQLIGISVEDIFEHGLHEWLTQFIVAINVLAVNLGSAYGFTGEMPAEPEQVPQ